MQRVLVLGCSGAGKSTFSGRLARITGLPHIELDSVFWRPGWTQTPQEEWLKAVATLSGQLSWIMDGNYSGSLHLRLPRADTAIFLDYPRHRCLRRVFRRTLKDYGHVREGMPKGCPERLDLEFLRYIWNFDKRSKPRILAAFATHGSHVRLHRLTSDRDAEILLAELSETRAAI